jgi:hypothetical protein
MAFEFVIDKGFGSPTAVIKYPHNGNFYFNRLTLTIYIYIEKWISLTPNSVSGTPGSALNVTAIGYPPHSNPVIEYGSGEYSLSGEFTIEGTKSYSVGYIQASFSGVSGDYSFSRTQQLSGTVLDPAPAGERRITIFNVGSKSDHGHDIHLNIGDSFVGTIYFYDNDDNDSLFAYSSIRRVDVLSTAP